MRRPILAFFSIFVLVAGLQVACSESESAAPKKAAGSASGSKGKPTKADPAPTTPDCTSSNSASATPGAASTGSQADPDDSSADLRLAGPGFETVKPYFDEACGSCHPGRARQDDYATYADAKANGPLILGRMKRDSSASGFMPQGAAKSDAKLALVEAWVNGGMQPEGGGASSASTAGGTDAAPTTTGGTDSSATAGDSSPTSSSTGDSSSSPCGGTSSSPSSGEPVTEPEPSGGKIVDTLINPPKKAECHNQGKPFQRTQDEGGGTCANATLATFACTKDGILAKLKNSEKARAAIVALEATGKTIEDCGTTPDGKLVAFFFCFSDKAGPTEGVCIQPAQVEDNQAFVKTSVFSATLPQ